jgi:NADH-quinone oxidoreductase subunit J
MKGETIIFIILSLSILVFSIASILDRRILRAAIYLLFVLVAVSGLFYMMGYQFLAAIQLILYAGGIVVLIIFSILLTSQINSKLDRPKSLHLISGLIIALGGVGLSIATILQFNFRETSEVSVEPTMRVIGLQLMNVNEQGYALPFEVISILLLAILVGTIFIARKSNV